MFKLVLSTVEDFGGRMGTSAYLNWTLCKIIFQIYWLILDPSFVVSER